MRGTIISNEAGICVICGTPSTCKMQGETDSMGAEVDDFCAACAAAQKAEQKAYLDATDVEDRAGTFLVSGSSQDDYRDICAAFRSYRAAVSALRCFERRCEPHGGTYPRDMRVQERADAFTIERQAREAAEDDW